MSDRLTPDPLALRRELGLLTEDELAAVADVDVRTVQSWRTERRGPPYTKIGRKVLYRVEAFARWLEEREKETQP